MGTKWSVSTKTYQCWSYPHRQRGSAGAWEVVGSCLCGRRWAWWAWTARPPAVPAWSCHRYRAAERETTLWSSQAPRLISHESNSFLKNELKKCQSDFYWKSLIICEYAHLIPRPWTSFLLSSLEDFIQLPPRKDIRRISLHTRKKEQMTPKSASISLCFPLDCKVFKACV